MIITMRGKKIHVTDKNARAYEKMNGIPLEPNDLFVYLNASYNQALAAMTAMIARMSEADLSNFLNQSVEWEIRVCCGDRFYEEA